jgi:Zn-dependent protease
MGGNATLHGFLLLAPVFVVSLVLHELAHGLAAYALGDRTAQRMGRLTLNPISHIDPLGSALIVIAYFSNWPLIGWAKPVPVDPRALRGSPQVGMALVGAAGPATNFLLALASGAVWAHTELTGDAYTVVTYGITVNVIFGLFNLIPIPPLDGSRIIAGFMPRETYLRWAELDQYGMYAVFALVFLFNDAFVTLLDNGFERVLRIISAIVGGHPMVA